MPLLDMNGTELRVGDCYQYATWLPPEYREITGIDEQGSHGMYLDEITMLHKPHHYRNQGTYRLIAKYAVKIDSCETCPNLFECLSAGVAKDVVV